MYTFLGARGVEHDNGTITSIIPHETPEVYTTELLFVWRGASDTVETLNPRAQMPTEGWSYVPWQS